MHHRQAFDLVGGQPGLFILLVRTVVCSLLFNERLEEIQEISLLLPLRLQAVVGRRSG